MTTKRAWILQASILLSLVAWIVWGPAAGAAITLAAAAGAVVTGGRATAGTQGIDQNSRVIDMSDTIHLLDPNLAPLTAITMKLRKAHAISTKVEWLEDDYVPSTSTSSITVSASTGSTTVLLGTAGHGSYFRAGDIIKSLSTGETMYVSGVTGDILTVTRSIGATAVAAIPAAGEIIVIGNANAEFATGRVLKTTNKTPQYNWTEIFRWPFGSSGTLQASELYGGDDMTYQSRKAGLEHRIQLEKAYLFGERSEDTSGATPLRTCDGVIARISTNVDTLGDPWTLTQPIMETFLRDAFRYGPAAKMLFCSRHIISFLNTIAATSIETIPTTESFPLALTEYVSGHGKVYLVTHNLLTGAGANEYAYQGWTICLDMDSVFHRYMQGRDTHIKTNIQANDEDGRKDEYKSECCPMLIQEKNHAILNDVRL